MAIYEQAFVKGSGMQLRDDSNHLFGIASKDVHAC